MINDEHILYITEALKKIYPSLPTLTRQVETASKSGLLTVRDYLEMKKYMKGIDKND